MIREAWQNCSLTLYCFVRFSIVRIGRTLLLVADAMAGCDELESLKRHATRRFLLFSAFLLTIACGLALRRFGFAAGLSFGIVKYGGSILWGAMVYWLLAAIFAGMTKNGIAWRAILLAIAVELFRLWHAPALDAFRLTTAGALLLGRVFSLWNMVAYAAGIAAALLFGHLISRTARLNRCGRGCHP